MARSQEKFVNDRNACGFNYHVSTSDEHIPRVGIKYKWGHISKLLVCMVKQNISFFSNGRKTTFSIVHVHGMVR